MTTAKFERARGTRDFAGAQALSRQRLGRTLSAVFELYGYNPLETPILERYDTLSSKYAGGDEILKETFKLKDQGDRELGLRYDLTVPLCRYIATNPNLKMPFKRYQIGDVFRDGPLKIGRYREFVQCDVDVVGVTSMAADAEMVEIAQKVFAELDINVVIKVNSRKVLNGIVAAAGIAESRFETTILTLDKLEKAGRAAVEKELEDKGTSASSIKKLMSFVQTAGSNREKIQKLEKELGEEGRTGLRELQEAFSFLADLTTVSFEPSLARGLAYYTGTVFEVFLAESSGKLKEIRSAVAAGGRYDKMISNFVGSGRDFPAVGISFGLDIIEDVLGLLQAAARSTTTAAYVIAIKIPLPEAKKVANQLRQNGIRTDLDLSGRDIKKNLEYVAAVGIPYAVFVGEKELQEGSVTIRSMNDGKEQKLPLAKAFDFLKV